MTTDLDVLSGRSDLYKFLAFAYRRPDADWEEMLKDGQSEEMLKLALQQLGLQGDKDCSGAVTHIQKALSDLPKSNIEDDFNRIFGNTLYCDCPPYETVYGQPHIFRQSQSLSDICGFYKAFGLDISDKLKERQDHISIEFEFMHFLAYREAYAHEHDGADKASICRDAQKKFMQEHCGEWIPSFTKKLEDAGRDGFYKWVAILTRGFLSYEKQHLGFSCGPSSLEIAESDLEEESCMACGDADGSVIR